MIPLMEMAEEIRLAHDQHTISIDFVGLHFRNPAGNRYAYRLEGFDTGWIDGRAVRTATYSNLPPGTYTFRVKAASADGVWNEDGASIRVVVRPPWWRTPWAYGAYVLLVGGAVLAVDRFQRRRLTARERARAEAEAARLRAEAAEARARALDAENRRAAAELEKAKELESAYAALEASHKTLKTTQAQLIQQEKLASLGALTAGIAHEIKNPLNFVNNFAGLTRELVEELEAGLRDATDPADLLVILADLSVNATKIEEHGQRADRIVMAMLEHSRGGGGARQRVDLNALVEEHVNLAYHGMRARVPDFKVTIRRRYDEATGRVELVPQEIGRLLLNLLGNAFYAVREKVKAGAAFAPEVTISTRRTDAAIVIEVADNGPGIPGDIRQKIFEPFFTTKPAGEGTGLGLSLSYDIVTQGHGGQMAVRSRKDEGTVFTITLPERSAISNEE